MLLGTIIFGFGSFECPQNHSFLLKQLWNLQDIPDTLLNLSQRKKTISIDIDCPPLLVAEFLVDFSLAPWQFRG
jgi:hypothetical protein